VLRWTCTPSRADSREGSSDGSEQEPAKPDVNVTPSIAVGERIWFGTAEGAVVCLDRKTGAEAWRYWTTGRIVSSPTWWQGRLYVGSRDGWVYCLDAATGELAWRYCLAPDGRRVMLWGYLSNASPVMANVLVEDGVAYAAAGFVNILGGSALCALDAHSGAVRWEKRFDAGSADASKVPTAGGQIAWYQGRLWWHCSEWGLAVVDPATGDLRPAIDLDRPTLRGLRDVLYGARDGVKRGQEIGILPGGWVVYGGRQFNLLLSWPEQPRATCCFLRADPDGPPQDAKGLPKLAVLNLSKAHNCGDLPVWDSSEVLLTGRPPAWQTAPLGPRLCRGFAQTLAADAAAHPFDVSKKDRSFSTVPVRRTDTEPPAGRSRLVLPEEWVKKYGNHFLSPILASNAVVFASGSGPRGVWNVLAVNRNDQTFLWDVQLPAMPVLGGMSLTRAGDVLVPLLNGRLVCIGDQREAIPRPAVRRSATQPGVIVQSYETDGAPTELPSKAEFARLKPTGTMVTAQVNLPNRRADNPYLLRIAGLLDVPTPGTYRFFLNSDKSYSRFLLDGETEFDCGWWGAQSGGIFLAKGKHPITIVYRHGEGGKTLRFEWDRMGLKRTEVPASALSHADAKEQL
jgi:hypothetical protein